MFRQLAPVLVAFGLFPFAFGVTPARAAERTFTFAPSGMVGAIDEFNAALITRSASLGRAVKIRRGALALAGKSCPSLAGDPARMLTRIQVLDGPARAAALAGRRKPNDLLGDVLAVMGGAVWGPPPVGRTHQLAWVAEQVSTGVAGFATAGYAIGDQTGALAFHTLPDIGGATFLFGANLANRPIGQPTNLVLALTTELPPTRPGRLPKRTECFLLVAAHPADLQALAELVAASPLAPTTRNRLASILDDAEGRLANGEPGRAARTVKSFAVEVAQRSATEIPPDAAEALMTRAMSVIEALGL